MLPTPPADRPSTPLPMPMFAWGCVVRNRFRFTYLYGSSAEIGGIVRQLSRGQFLHRGECATFEDARRAATEAAAEMQRMYGELGGSGQALPAALVVDGGPALAQITDLPLAVFRRPEPPAA